MKKKTRKAAPRRTDRPRSLCVLILAAGRGKRMQSRRVKLLHFLGGRSMLLYVVEAVTGLNARKVLLVVGNQQDEVRTSVEAAFKRKVRYVVQKQQLGTGHAVGEARKELAGIRGDVLILNGDLPTLRKETLQQFVKFHRENGALVSLLTTVAKNPAGYGRVIRNYIGDVARIVEDSDTTPEEAKIREINSGIYLVDIQELYQALEQITSSNRQGEYYLTDIVEILRREGKRVAALQHRDRKEILGVNNRVELAEAQKILRLRKARLLMLKGVTLVNPEATYVDHDVRVGRDTIIYPGTVLDARTSIGEECTIGISCHISNSTIGSGVQVLDYCRIQDSRIHRNARVGPFAHLRPESVLQEGARVGNFVETKKSTLGKGSKANHLSYLGDSKIGKDVNIGAGTITCNFDGVNKHRTQIDDNVFIGSDTQLVAPVRIRRGAYIGAGSTITEEVPANALAICRGRQVVKKNWARKHRSVLEAAQLPRKSSRGPRRSAPAGKSTSRSPGAGRASRRGKR